MRLTHYLLIPVLCTALLLPARLLADDVPKDWWGELRKAAASCFDSRNIKVEVITGAGSRTLGEVARSGPFGEIRLTIPLFSLRQRQEQKQKQGQFLEHAAEILRELREAEALIQVNKDQAEVLKEAMIQEGLAGIKAYFQIQKEVAALETAAAAAKMKLTGHILACGGK